MHDKRIMQFGQGREVVRQEWPAFAKRLGRAALVWEVLRRRAENGLVRMTRNGIARRTGLTERQVKRALAKLREVGLIKDVGRVWRSLPKGNGYVEGWCYIREVSGTLLTRNDFPYMVMVPRASEKRISEGGRGGARKGAGRPRTKPDRAVEEEGADRFESTGFDRKKAYSKRSAPYSKRSEPPSEIIEEKNQSGPPVKYLENEQQNTESSTASSDEDARRQGGASSELLSRPRLDKYPVTPSPLRWDRLPINDRSAAHHVVRLYASFRLARYGKRFFWRGSAEKQKWWPALLTAVQKMRELDITPAEWLAWVDGAVWHGTGEKKTPPPISMVFSTSLMEKHQGWFHGTAADYLMPAQAHNPPSLMKVFRLWKESRKPGAAPNVLPRVEYDRLMGAAQQEAVEIQNELHERVREAEWLW